MQFKTLALAAAVAVASVSAYDNNACTACVYNSIPGDSVCKTLNATVLADVTSCFGVGTFNLPKLSGLIVQDPTVKSCICHWASTAFTPTGSAASCTAGATPTCNSTQLADASVGISQVAPGLNCNAVAPSGGSPSASGSAPSTATPSGGTKPPAGGNAAVSINVPYVVSIAAIGLAALAGL